MAYRTFKLEVAYPKFDGQPAKGTVEIECSEQLVVDAAGNRILSGKVVVKLDDYGTAEVTLPDPSDTSLNPAGFGYTVTANLHHGRLASVSFGAEAIVDGVVRLAAVTPVDPSTFDPEATYAPLATVNELGTRVTTLEETPAVTSYNDLTDKPTIPSTAADVGALPDTTTAADLGALAVADADTQVATLAQDPLSETGQALSATYATRSPLEAFAKKVRAGQAVTVGFAADSTSDETPEWPRRTIDALLAGRPWYTHTYHAWSDASQAYTTTTPQTGAAQYDAGIVYDDFARTAAELVGTTAPRGAGNWSGASGAWSLPGDGTLAWKASTGYTVLVGGIASSFYKVSGRVTVPVAAGTTNNVLNLGSYKSGTNAERISLFIRVTTSGNVVWGIEAQTPGFATIATGTTNPIPTGTTGTYDWSLLVNGTSVTATLNGVTVTGTLSAAQAASVAQNDSLFIQPTNDLTGWKVHPITRETYGLTYPVAAWVTRNGAKAGSDLTYQQTRLATLYPEPLDVLFISSSHNYGATTADAYLTALGDFITAFRAAQPNAAIVLVSQNPELPPQSQANRDAHRDRNLALPQYAADHGYGYVGAFEAFRATDGWETLVRTDGVHPTAASTYDNQTDPNNGQYLWMSTALDYLAAEGITA